MRSFSEAEEELATVCARASISHGEDTTACMLVLEVLVSEVRAIDGFATSAVSSGEVATLGHKTSNDAMESAALEMKRLS